MSGSGGYILCHLLLQQEWYHAVFSLESPWAMLALAIPNSQW
jgi:hypothetical protein